MKTSVDARKKESYKIFDQIAPTYDALNHVLSMGIDIRWRKKLALELPEKKDLVVLDLATGTGDVALHLAHNLKIKTITGLDLSEKMIEIGREKVKKKNFGHKVFLKRGDGMNIPYEDNSVDLVTLSFGIRNFSDPLKGLHEIYRVLKPGGRVLVMEFSIPKNRIVKETYFFYFRKLLPWIGNKVSGHKDAYSYLNQTVESFPYGQQFLSLMSKAKLEKLKAKPLTFGIATLYIGDKA
jgi:demethylmenaquinone methyltransferase/2-methoxy-6-polyprenyl-1,4-benzoquinol methylase